MKNVTAGFRTMLRTSSNLMMCDLYTITLATGAVSHITDAPVDVIVSGVTYTASNFDNEAGIRRGPIKLTIGLMVDSIEVDMLYDSGTLFMGVTPGAFAAAGGFDGARIKIDKLLCPPPDFSDTTRGSVNLFNGVVAESVVGNGRVTLNVTSDLISLSAAFPRNYLIPACNNALFDSNCTLDKATFAVAGTCTAGNTKTLLTASALTQATDYFALGSVTMLTGVNAGLQRAVRNSVSGQLTLLYPFPQPCANGDTFTAYPGDDKTEATCLNKFNNLPHFRGFPYVPNPEVSQLGQDGGVPGDTAGAGAGSGHIAGGSGGQNTNFKQQ